MTAAARIEMERAEKPDDAEIVLGEDWEGNADGIEQEMRERREQRSLVSLNRSPLARKIVVFNLLALVVLVTGVLYLNPFRDNLVLQREQALVREARLIADVFEAQLPRVGPVSMAVADGISPEETLAGLQLPEGADVFVYDTNQTLVSSSVGLPRSNVDEELVRRGAEPQSTVITDFLNSVWELMSKVFAGNAVPGAEVSGEEMARDLVAEALGGFTLVQSQRDAQGNSVFSVASPILQGDRVVGAVALTTIAGEIDHLVRQEREQVLQMFVIAILVSVGLSLVLASTIANPLSDLAAAAELGRDKNARKMSPNRVRIPDLSARPDEIGRLSNALRGMVRALYDRIEANDQFAADVSHELKNPLSSLRSAVDTLRVAKNDVQRGRLLDVIEHDVRRLDRLVTDISAASRLDADLVKEEMESFDLIRLIRSLASHHANEARKSGVEFIADLPDRPVPIQGLEGRLAQVFVNLLTNAVSFCEEGDAVRIWVRRRENRVLVVVEDTGPGIPDNALGKIFKRFYSERPQQQFGNNSGLGLSISKQIVEAHGGVIWAENIRPTDADPTSEPLGARFVVGLPV
ncbi:histidine kinase [Maritimibacter sp. 55A14]|uniref:sensor histidine kinase n=1 Tax=Maritimibacter sp. 55A14 TaxID=2174844 RepID=UPI000D61514E|nr:sensor histidine kinase [Maritimibacter sp. 55A14]PWE32504.1 histidine kinase [Maritimibacter sp. 55A14]